MKIQNPNVKIQINLLNSKHNFLKFVMGILLVICHLSLVILNGLALAQEVPKSAWATYGMLINDTPGNTPQQNPQITSDGRGNHIIVWEDGRAGYYDIYAQKIDASGAPLWDKNGIPVCNFSGNQNSPRVIKDGRGGVIITWQDYREGNSDIYAQRIGASGQLLWGKGGTIVCSALAEQFAPDIVSDKAGGAYITWYDYRSGKGEDIYAQRISLQGTPLWKKNGISICSEKGTQWYPRIARDGASGAIIVWSDGRKGPSNNDIYAQRITSSGKVLWGENGKAISVVPYNQERPTIMASEKGAIIAWQDFRSGNIDIYAQKVDLEGKLLWSSKGVAASTAPFSQENPQIVSDGFGGAIIAWTDERVDKSDIYAQRIYRDGRVAWQTNGRAVCKTGGRQKNPKIINLKNKEWTIVWEDSRRGNTDLYAQKINSAGTSIWKTNGMLISSARLSQDSPAISSTPSGNTIVVWQDKRFGNYDIYAQKLSSAGTLLWGKPGNVICAAKGSVIQQKAELIDNQKGEIILVFEDARSGFLNIYAQKIDKHGKLAWGKDGLPVAKIASDQFNPQLVADGSDGAIIAWEDHRNPKYPTIRAQRINTWGQKMWKSSLSVGKFKSRQTHPVIISDGASGAIIAWQDNRNALDLQDIYAQRISSQGKALWGKKGKALVSHSGEQTDIDIIADGSGGAFLAWTDYRRGDRNPDIYSQRINNQGNPLWKREGILVCGAPDIQRIPRLALNGDGGVLIAWTDKGGGSYDIYAQRVNKYGKPLWITDGLPINQLSRTQQNPKFGGKKVVVWEDYRFGNWDIFAGKVDSSGKLLWGKKGVPVVSASHTQYAPQVIEWKNGSVIIVWEDYRNGKYYETYVQKLDKRGRPFWDKNGIKIQSQDGGRSPKILANPAKDSFFIFWEDYTNGGRAIYGQKFRLD